ncbi:MAG: hypothetical protein PWP66_518 [Thermosediminibacterales bacterium]|jgi:dTDP-glucose pyrophosphorylase|nr:hypothetical protein [Thermosediminibacterales bacterium]
MIDLIISKDITIIEAMRKLDISARKILLVVENDRLCGVITDGDIRRCILKNGDLNEKVEQIMNRNPITLSLRNREKALSLMLKHNIEAIPLVDDEGLLKSIVFWNELADGSIKETEKIDVPVVIMAGGKGTRLHPYTRILPKPLIPIGDTPIIERIINKFHQFGCTKFYLTVNYKKNMIKSYFGEMERDYQITYIEEKKPLGTGGSLSLLKDEVKTTFFVSNCDILVDADYVDILKKHKENNNKITIVASLKVFEVPYGVIQLEDDGRVRKIVEKPKHTYLVNTGFYVLEPETIDDIPENTFFDLPNLYEYYLEKGEKVGIYPISEGSWMDMGEIENLQDMLKRLNVEE